MREPVARLVRVCAVHYLIVVGVCIICPFLFCKVHADIIIMLVSFFNTVCVTERGWAIQLEMMKTLSAPTRRVFTAARTVTVMALGVETMFLMAILSAAATFARVRI